MNSLNWISKVVLLVMLGLCAFFDLKEKTMPVLIMGIGFISGIAFQIFWRHMPFWVIAAGCGVGLIILGIAFLSRQSIGYGDGLLFIATGAFLGFTDNLCLLGFSLGVSMIVGIGLMTINKFNRKMKMPFAPCILCGYLGLIALE